MKNLQVEERTLFSRIDFNLVLVIFALNIIGLINLYSATHGLSHNDKNDLFWLQIGWLMVSWLIFFGITFIDYKWFVKFAWVAYVLNLLSLVAVKAFGKVALGAQRWLDLGFFRYQPSETMKLGLVLALAGFLAKRSYQGGMGLFSLVRPTLILLPPFALTVIQPDLGTAMLLAIISGSMILFIGVRSSILIVAMIAAIVAAPLIWNFGLRDYQRDRVMTFLSPGRDPRGAGYNSIQSKIAVGSGQILGKGFRKGSQSQLEFLPERHTDFIFSVLSEEHGFVGSITTLALFVVIFFMGIRIASQAPDKTGALVAIGVIAYLFWHVTINMGMVVGLLPIVGVPLPLLSYGGSSMLTTMTAMGLLSSVAYRRYLF